MGSCQSGGLNVPACASVCTEQASLLHTITLWSSRVLLTSVRQLTTILRMLLCSYIRNLFSSIIRKAA